MSSPARRWARRLAIVGTGVLTLVVAVLALLQLPPVATWLMRRLVTVLPLNAGYRLEVGAVSGDWLHRLALDDVRLMREGRELARVDRLKADYDLRQVRAREPRLRELNVDGARVVTRRAGDTWDLASALRPSADTTSSAGGFTLERLNLRDVELVAQLAPDSAWRVRGLNLRARNLVLGPEPRVQVDQLNAAVAPPGTTQWFALATRGSVTRDELRFDPFRIQTEETRVAGRMVLPRDLDDPALADRLDVELRATPLALADLAAFVPGVTPEGHLQLDARARGSADGLVTARLGARLADGTITLDGLAPLAGKGADYRLQGTFHRLDPARLYQSAPAGSLNGRIQAKVSGPALARSNGRLEFRLARSRLAGKSFERLNLRADLHRGSAVVALRGSVEGGSVSANGRIRPFDSIPQFRLRGDATGVPGTEAVARTLAGDAGEPVLSVHFQLEGSGFSAANRRLSGRVELAALRKDGERAPLGHSTVALGNGRLEAHPELYLGRGTITADVIARLGDTVSYEVRRGTIDRVNLGELMADTSLAPVSGRFSVWGQGLAPTEAIALARLELDELRYGSRTLERVTGSARLAAGRAHIQLGTMMQGGRLAVDAEARPFQRTRMFTLSRASLTDVDLGTFFGRPDLAGPVTLHLTGSGHSRGDIRAFRGRLTVEPSRLGGIEVRNGLLAVTLSGERLVYDGMMRTNGGTLALAGEGRPFGDSRSFVVRQGRADSLDLGTLLGRPNLRTGINAQFTGAMSPGSSDDMEARLAVKLLPSRINQAQLDGGRMDIELERGTTRADVQLVGRDGELQVEMNGSMGGVTTVHTEGTLRLERLSRWTGRADADGRLESRFALDLTGDSTGLASIGGSVDAIGGVGEVRLKELHLALRPDSGVIQVDTLFVRSNVVALDGSGRLALRESAGIDTLRLTGTTLNVGPLVSLIGGDSVTLDSGRVAITLSGPAQRWRVDGEADVHRILSGNTLAELLTVRAGAALDSSGVSGISGEMRVEGAALGSVRVPRARFAGRYDSLFTAEADVAVGDSLGVIAGLQGAVGPDTLNAVLQRLDLREGDRQWSLEQPANVMLRPYLTIDGLGLRSGTRRILVDGTFNRTGSSDIALRLSNVDLDILREVKLSPIGGRVDGWLRLTGPAETPALEGAVGLTVRSRNGRDMGRIRTDVAWTRTGLRLDATAKPLRGGPLTVNGTIPWRLTLAPSDTAAAVGVVRSAADTLALAVRADSFDLGFFEPLIPPEAARDLRGRVVADASVSGRIDAPRANGSIQVSGVAVTLPTLDLSYKGGELAGRLAGDELRVDRLRLSTGKHETVTAQGTVRLRPISDPSLDLGAELKNFRISHSSSLHAVASGQVHLTGTAAAPSLTGRLTMGRTDIIVGGGQASATVEDVELTPDDLRQVARRFGPAALARTGEESGLVDRFHLDLNLRLPRRVWFRKRTSPRADIELSGRVRLRQEPGQPMEFFGRVEPVPGRGGLDVYGREFRLSGGEINLAGPTDSIALDITAQYQVPTQGGPDDEGVLIDVAAKGHPDSIALEFTGDPEMNQDDMLSYIVTGRPSSDNLLAGQTAEGQGESAGEMGAAVALSGLTQSLSTAAEAELGLDVFQIRQEGLQGLTLTAGRYVGSRVFLSMHLPIELGGEDQQTPGTNLGPTFELEWVAERWLRANVRGGNVPPRFTLRSRYAY
jgi:autotransporter translocation and assembly factor TamB